MKKRFTKNHIVIIEDDGQIQLQPTMYLKNRVGENACCTFHEEGTEIAAGSSFGHMEGDNGATQLYTPFSCKVKAVVEGEDFVFVELTPDSSVQLMDEEQYKEYIEFIRQW